MKDNTHPLISVIIPVYNTRDYLEECLESVLKQDYTDLEILLVDDGSTDDSLKLCLHYEKTDGRVKAFHQKNAGVSAARNNALERAQGDYICFVDSDDWLEKDFFSTLINSSNGEPLIICGYKRVAQGTLLQQCAPQTASYYDNESIKKAYREHVINTFLYGPVSKLYKREVIKGIFFDTELTVAEDIVFNLQVLAKTECLKAVDYCGYNVRVHHSSATNVIERKYTPMYEHSYTYVSQRIYEARENWGYTKEELSEDRIDSRPMRYYHEVSNLFRSGTPYSKREKIEKIREIHNDVEFIQEVLKKDKSKLTKAERVSRASAKLNPVFSFALFSLLLKLKKEI